MIRPIVFGLTVVLLSLYAEGRSEDALRAEAIPSNSIEVRAEAIPSNSVGGRAEAIASTLLKTGVDSAVEQNSDDSSSEDEDGPCHRKSNSKVSCTGGDDCVDENDRPCSKKDDDLQWWIIVIICCSVVACILLVTVICIKFGWCPCCRQAGPSVHNAPDKVNNSYDHTPPGTPLSQSQIWTTEKVNPTENSSVPDPPPYAEKVPGYVV